MSKKQIVDEETYLDAVRKKRTLVDNQISDYIGVHRSTVGRFRRDNPDVYKKAVKIIDKLEKITFDNREVKDFDTFIKIPIIAEWYDILVKKKISDKYRRNLIFGIMNTCNAIGIHPSNLNIDVVSNYVLKWKLAQDEGRDYPSGCSYNNIRHGLRSFFKIMKGVSGDQLTIKGVGAEHGDNFGESARERIFLDEREKIINNMRKAILQVFKDEDVDIEEFPIDDYWLEMTGLCVFLYYTGTRITASLDARFRDKKNVFKKGYYEIHVVDKGKKGGIHWQKRLKENGYHLMSLYIKERHGIDIEAQTSVLKSLDKRIFPLLAKDYDLECSVMKKVQKISGCYKITAINHLWRHTFAQDWLMAMDGNYEVGAEIGGWKDIGTMKRCYGAVSETTIQRGLNKAMGLPVEENDYKLRFLTEEKDQWMINMIKNRGNFE